MDTLHLRKKKRAKSPPRPSPRGGVSTQHTRVGEADTDSAGEQAKLPHERDQSVTEGDASEPAPSQRRVAEQARRDLERGSRTPTAAAIRGKRVPARRSQRFVRLERRDG